jgi:DNA-binding CsgD family transcriptional regulator
MVAAFLLGTIARDEPDQLLFSFVIDPPPDHPEALTHGETRVLHYLPTHLSAREIADELYLSVNTVKTHQRHLYQKLGARSRTQAVEQARALGLLAPLSHSHVVRRQGTRPGMTPRPARWPAPAGRTGAVASTGPRRAP